MPDDRKPDFTQDVDRTHEAAPSAGEARAARAARGDRHRRRNGEGDDERFPARATADPVELRSFANGIARLLADDRCEHVVVLDVREVSQVAEYVVIATGTSQRQMSAALRHAVEEGKGRGIPAWRTSEDDRTTWLLADFVDIVVHLFEPNTRAHYDLEMLWGDADRVDWRAELDLPKGYPLQGGAEQGGADERGPQQDEGESEDGA